ncbi:hypothetical protein [Flavobacterium sp.]|uniref:hypothetical protein n=1 Tax=Flavobacterium sp. TaxID=239 RepID=UPI001B591BEE|nr:hypothetical protein [Flavobacterium sp.]MBP6181870.1 hypothetical protein [Flavobacterium sp.]
MKKTALFLEILLILAIVSCKKKDDKPFTPQVETLKATTTSTPATSGEVKDSTSIKVRTDDVTVTTKDNATKTNVNVSGGEAKIEIKN